MIEVDIVSPSKRLVEGIKVNSLRLPAIKGEIEVLPGHAEFLTILSTGVLSLILDGGTRQFAVSCGFAEIRNDKVIVLAETIEEQSEIDKTRAAQAQKRAEEKLSGVMDEAEFRKNKAKLQRAVVRQSITH